MPDLLLPIGNHYFSAEALQKIVASIEAEHPGKANVLAATVDSSGAQVVLALGATDGAWKINAAFAHQWSSGNTFGGGGSIAW